MMKMRYLLPLALALLTACGGPDKFVISGNFENAAGKTIYLKNFINGRPSNVDSAIISESGAYKIQTNLLKLDFYGLTIDQQNYINLILDSTDAPEISGDAKTMQKGITITGSPYSEQLADFYRRSDRFTAQLDSLKQSSQRMGANIDPMQRELLIGAFNSIVEKQSSEVIAFLEANPTSPVSLAMVWKLNRNDEFDRYLALTESLEPVLSHSDSFQRFKNDIRSMQGEMAMQKQQEEEQQRMATTLAPGKPAPDITLNDVNGKPLSLSSLRGKTVLIDFWASWCRPCRVENPNVVRVYKKYKNRGFEVFSVSLDNDRSRWTNAIAQDGLEWPSHVSDLAGWNSSAAKLYGVTGIPYTLLIDKEGNIIRTELRGPALEQELAKIYGS